MARAVQAAHPDATVLAFDISKDSVQLAAREDAGCAVRWFVGNLAELPVRDGAVDCVLDVFSPVNYAEFTRVLGGSGVVLKVVPGARHDEQRASSHAASCATATIRTSRLWGSSPSISMCWNAGSSPRPSRCRPTMCSPSPA